MIKVILLAAVFACIVYIGIGFASHYKKRQNFFSALCNFCQYLNAEIGFNSKNLKTIIEASLGSPSKEFNSLLMQFDNCLGKKSFSANYSALSQSELQAVNNFFNALGHYDTQTEKLSILHSSEVFKNFLHEATCDVKKNYSTIIKLCVLLGIAVVVLLI